MTVADWKDLREGELQKGRAGARQYLMFVAEANWGEANTCLTAYNGRRQNILQQDEWFAQGFTTTLVEHNIRTPAWVFLPWFERVDLTLSGMLHPIPS